MEKKVMIAIDDSFYSKKAMEYAAAIGSLVKELRYVLFHVQPKISEFLVEDSRTDPKAVAALRNVKRQNRARSNNILEEAHAYLSKKGVDERHIEIVSEPYRRGTARSILHYGAKVSCNAVIIGHRGVSRLAESFVGSVANSVLAYTKTMPVWAVGGSPKTQKIMVAIDGSESALRAVAHVARMTSGNPSAKITLFHVTPRLRDYCTVDFEADKESIEKVISRGDKKCVDDFYVHAKHQFEKAEIKRDQIIIREVGSTMSIGKSIVNEAREGEFGTVVVGRSGLNKSFFIGSVSQFVINQASNCAVWMVP